ncbi:HNH endonuclease [Paenibacillus polymyxa]|uniref:HNH endonuclease n=1 Tax=Paenibacillus polymyxa TaxID=1406 RepID=UPI00069877D7|nr:HNH endonuclease [Paenibacillus polymyxa]
MRGRTWGESEIEYLTANISSVSVKDIATTLNRSQSSVRNKAHKLSLIEVPEETTNKQSHRYDTYLAELNSLSMTNVRLVEAFKHEGWLRYHYEDLEFSEQDIAEITDCTRKNIEYWLRKYDIPRRDTASRYTERCLRKISEAGKGRIPFSKGLTKHDHPSIMLISEKVSGENSPTWKGGFYIDNNGYRKVREIGHPRADKDGYVLEHRLVMEYLLGRLLTSAEVVHHRDHNRRNNLSQNLFLFPNNKAHSTFHMHKRHINQYITEEQFMSEVFVNAA